MADLHQFDAIERIFRIAPQRLLHQFPGALEITELNQNVGFTENDVTIDAVVLVGGGRLMGRCRRRIGIDQRQDNQDVRLMHLWIVLD